MSYTSHPAHTMRPLPGHELAAIRCWKCHHCWVRQIPVGALGGQWLCPRGWTADCAGMTWERVDRPDILVAFMLFGRHGFGDDGVPEVPCER